MKKAIKRENRWWVNLPTLLPHERHIALKKYLGGVYTVQALCTHKNAMFVQYGPNKYTFICLHTGNRIVDGLENITKAVRQDTKLNI